MGFASNAEAAHEQTACHIYFAEWLIDMLYILLSKITAWHVKQVDRIHREDLDEQARFDQGTVIADIDLSVKSTGSSVFKCGTEGFSRSNGSFRPLFALKNGRTNRPRGASDKERPPATTRNTRGGTATSGPWRSPPGWSSGSSCTRGALRARAWCGPPWRPCGSGCPT